MASHTLAVTEKKALNVNVNSVSNCEIQASSKSQLMIISGRKGRDLPHFFSGGMISFARGLNDSPKIVRIETCLRLIV